MFLYGIKAIVYLLKYIKSKYLKLYENNSQNNEDSEDSHN